MRLDSILRLEAQRAQLEGELVALMPGALFDRQSRKLKQIYLSLEQYRARTFQEAAVLLTVAADSMKDNGPFESLTLEVEEIANRLRNEVLQIGDAYRLRAARGAIADLPDLDHEPWSFEMGFYWGGELKERALKLIDRTIECISQPRLVHEESARTGERSQRSEFKIAL